MKVFTSRRTVAVKGILLALFFSLSLCGCSDGDGNAADGNVTDAGQETSGIIESETADNTEDTKDAETGDNESKEDVSSGQAERKSGEHPEEYYVKWAVSKGCIVSYFG